MSKINSRIKNRSRVRAKAEEETDDEKKIIPQIIQAGGEDIWMSHGVDLDNRIIDLTGNVTEAMSSFIIRALIKLNTMSQDPITIYLSSVGGSLLDGLAIYDLMRASPSPIVVYANGKILSMGIILLVAGDKRFAAKHTRFMMHQASYEMTGTLTEHKVQLKEIELQDDLTVKILASRTKLTSRKINELLVSDHWFDLTTAKKYGILTKDKVVRKTKPKRKAKSKGRK